jgi:dTDP-glucose 4,6-dehydratase
MRNVLVIGSNSFAGSHFINFLLEKKIKVFGVSRREEINDVYLSYKKNKFIKNFQFHKINLNKLNDLKYLIKIIKRKNIQYIANFAAQGMVAESWVNPNHWYFTNVVSNSLLVKELTKMNIKKYLNFSTPEVYGDMRVKKKESNIFNPNTPYAISRSAQDLNLLAHFKTFNFPAVITRAANIYGPCQQAYRIVPKSIISGLKRNKIPIHGKGNSIRSFIFIHDVSKALYKILFDKNNCGETFHISTNNFINVLDLVKLILKIINAKENLIFNVKERDGKDLKYLLDSSNLRKKYNWKDETTLEQGLVSTCAWIKANFDYLKKISLNYNHIK